MHAVPSGNLTEHATVPLDRYIGWTRLIPRGHGRSGVTKASVVVAAIAFDRLWTASIGPVADPQHSFSSI